MGIFDFLFKRGPKECGKEEKFEEIGVVTHYFPHVKAGVVKLTKGSLKTGDEICIKGHTTDFRQPVKSLQINRVSVQEGSKGQEVGIKVKSRVRIGDIAYKA